MRSFAKIKSSRNFPNLQYRYQTTDLGVTSSESECRRQSIKQRLHESLYQTGDAGVSLSDSRCRILFIRQRMRDAFHQESCAGVPLLDIRCRHVGLLRTSSVRISFCQDTTCIFNSLAGGRVTIVTMHSLRRLIHWTVTMFL